MQIIEYFPLVGPTMPVAWASTARRMGIHSKRWATSARRTGNECPNAGANFGQH